MKRSDLEQMKDLVLWARSEHVTITHATVGSVQIVFHDTKLTQQLVKQGNREAFNENGGHPVPKDIYAQFGGPLFNGPEPAPPPAERNEPTIEDEDD